METIIYSSFSLVSHGMFLKAIYDTYDTLKQIAEHPYIKSNLEELDMDTQLQLIEHILGDIEDQYKSESLKISISKIHEIIEKIKETLIELDAEIKLHDQRYFNMWRLYYFDPYLNKLRRYKTILGERFDLMLRIKTMEKLK